nr:hypothetical protein [Tanacetum cinerariifolium]
MQLKQDKAKESCTVSFRRLHSHLKLLSNNDLKRTLTEEGFKRAFATLFRQDVEIFTGIMFLNVDQLEKQLNKEKFQEIESMAAFKVLETQFQKFIKSRTYLDDEYVVMICKYFLEYTQLEIREFCDTPIQHMEYVMKSIDKKTLHKRDLVETESSGTELGEQDTSSRLGNDAHADVADIRPIYDEEPMAEVQLTAECINDMVHNHYLEEAKKKTHESGRNSRPSVMPYAKSQSTANSSKPKPKIDNKKSSNWHASKSSCVMTKTVPIAKNSRNSRYFFDSKHFVCSTCQKCVFNANYDSCVTIFPNEVNSRAKVSYHKTTNRYKPVEQISVPKKPERQIPTGHRFSIKKTSTVHEKTTSPRSCLR